MASAAHRQGKIIIKRRQILIALGASALARPFPLLAQQGKVWRVGFLAQRHVDFVDSDYYYYRDTLIFQHHCRLTECFEINDSQYYGPFTQGMRELGYSDYVEAGGLMSYGQNIREPLTRAATYVDKIFKGANSGDLPVEQPTTFGLFINRKTANALGLKIPDSMLVQATKVIE